MKITVNGKEIEINIESPLVMSNSKDKTIKVRFDVVPSRKLTEYEEEKVGEILHQIIREAV